MRKIKYKLFCIRNITAYVAGVGILCMLLGGIWYNASNINYFINRISGIDFEENNTFYSGQMIALNMNRGEVVSKKKQ